MDGMDDRIYGISQLEPAIRIVAGPIRMDQEADPIQSKVAQNVRDQIQQEAHPRCRQDPQCWAVAPNDHHVVFRRVAVLHCHRSKPRSHLWK